MHNAPENNNGGLRVGAVSYLNSKPLIFGLEERLPEGSYLALDLPSRLADQLAARNLDIALIPSIEFFSDPAYSIFSDACIACRGPVWSVKLLFRCDPSRVQTLALDEGSRTSVALAKVLLADRFNLDPRCIPLPIGTDPRTSTADAVLIIGDRAMRNSDPEFLVEWDLGEEWRKETGLPFVFAMWVGYPLDDSSRICAALNQARDSGRAATARIAIENAGRYGLSNAQCQEYLDDYLHFTLGEDELKGLGCFYRRASRLGLIPQGCAPSSSWVANI